MNIINESHSLYAIYLKINCKANITVGKLGTFDFLPGIYIYVGSAKKNIKARINRHIKIDKPFRWHFDYIRPYGEIVKIETFNSNLSECDRAKTTMEQLNAIYPIKGFGSSDCNCKSHLFFIANYS